MRKFKTKVDGMVERFKTRLIAKGFTLEYDKTFAPVAHLTFAQCFLAIAAIK